MRSKRPTIVVLNQRQFVLSLLHELLHLSASNNSLNRLDLDVKRAQNSLHRRAAGQRFFCNLWKLLHSFCTQTRRESSIALASAIISNTFTFWRVWSYKSVSTARALWITGSPTIPVVLLKVASRALVANILHTGENCKRHHCKIIPSI